MVALVRRAYPQLGARRTAEITGVSVRTVYRWCRDLTDPRDRAMELTAVNWHDTPAQIRADLWRTPDGRKLMALARDDRKPTTIAKAGDHTDARALLKQWQDDPKKDLPPIMVSPSPRSRQ